MVSVIEGFHCIQTLEYVTMVTIRFSLVPKEVGGVTYSEQVKALWVVTVAYNSFAYGSGIIGSQCPTIGQVHVHVPVKYVSMQFRGKGTIVVLYSISMTIEVAAFQGLIYTHV